MVKWVANQTTDPIKHILSKTRCKHHLKQRAQAEKQTTHSAPTIHIYSELNWDALPGFVLVSRGPIHPFRAISKETRRSSRRRKGRGGGEGEAMRSMGHTILPQGSATGHCARAEFHHLQEKQNQKNQTRLDAVEEWMSTKALNRQFTVFLLILLLGVTSRFPRADNDLSKVV